MAQQLIQKCLFTVPATTGPHLYPYNFKSDELYKYLTGIACPLVTALPTAEEIKIELRDDYRSILSFSPVQNWCKNTAAADFDLTAVFRPLVAESAGKNFYLNVKVKNSTSAFTFVALFRQENEAAALAIFGQQVQAYDMQSFTIPAAALGSNYNINLPSNYRAVAGVNFIGGDPANFFNIALDINDNVRQLLDPVPVSCLLASENTGFDRNFFPLSFESANKQVNVRLTPLTTIGSYTDTDITVTFLLVR